VWQLDAATRLREALTLLDLPLPQEQELMTLARQYLEGNRIASQ
jgi:hypothetical protein